MTTKSSTKRKTVNRKRAAPLTKRLSDTDSKPARVELRTDERQKHLIERGAALSGQPLSVFIMTAATARAREVIRENDVLVLSDGARNALLSLLESPPKPPSKALVAAFAGHRQLVDSA